MKIDNLKYIRYSRKSSESKEKQALSIADQNKEAEIYSSKEEIGYSYKFEESKTAFKPNKRAMFDEMIDLISKGKANSIVTWKEDRLCRNPKEGGNIIQMLQDGIIKEIRIISSGMIYTSDSDHLVLNIHFGMANQFSRNLSLNVTRGLRRKITDRKEYPRPAIIGFIGFGERGHRNIKPDPIMAPLIRIAFEMASTGLYSLGYLVNYLYDQGLRTKKGKKVGKSHLFTILKTTTYYGFVNWRGELCELNIEPIISKGLFDLVQDKLDSRSKPKKYNWESELIGLIKCSECECAITMTVKKKYLKKSKDYKLFVYYHCTHRKGKCSQKPITENEMRNMLSEQINRISIDEEVWKLGLELVKAKYSEELKANKRQLQVINQQRELMRDQMNKLVDMRISGELTMDEYTEQKSRISDKLSSLNNKSIDNDDSFKTWLELSEEFFNTAFQAHEVINSGTLQEKKEMLLRVGENFFLKDKKLIFSFKQPFDILLKTDIRSDVLPSLLLVRQAHHKLTESASVSATLQQIQCNYLLPVYLQ